MLIRYYCYFPHSLNSDLIKFPSDLCHNFHHNCRQLSQDSKTGIFDMHKFKENFSRTSKQTKLESIFPKSCLDQDEHFMT